MNHEQFIKLLKVLIGAAAIFGIIATLIILGLAG